MKVKIVICLLLLKSIDIISTATLRANQLIQNICDTLQNNNSFQLDEDQQWKIICQELFFTKNDDQYIRKERDIMDEENDPPDPHLRKAVVRVGAGIRTGGSGIRTGGSGIRTGSTGIRTGGTSGSSSSITRFRNTQTGGTIPRPNGWLWSRSQLIFLPLATRFFKRPSSSSNRYTTPVASSLTYYYCTSSDESKEIQCSSADGDTECCQDEDESNGEVFCCGGEIPDYILQDMNRATQTIARILYTLSALAMCMHLFMRRFQR